MNQIDNHEYHDSHYYKHEKSQTYQKGIFIVLKDAEELMNTLIKSKLYLLNLTWVI